MDRKNSAQPGLWWIMPWYSELPKSAQELQFQPTVTNWVFPKIGVPQNGWFIMEDPIKMDDLGVPLFLETPNCIQLFYGSQRGTSNNVTKTSRRSPNSLFAVLDPFRKKFERLIIFPTKYGIPKSSKVSHCLSKLRKKRCFFFLLASCLGNPPDRLKEYSWPKVPVFVCWRMVEIAGITT